ncbi:hypothetical protein HDZ31DRAFT_50729, partial [Schizophyllum fasciatum]
MPPKLPSPLEVLRKGLAKLKESTDSRKNDILTRLHKGDRVNLSEEAFVDDDANFTIEQLIIDSLDKASDYDKAVSQLTPDQKTVVDRLRELAGMINPANIKKRKRPDHKPSPIPLVNKKEPVFTEKQNATLAQRIEVLDWHHKNGKSQKKTAEHFDKQWPNLKLKQPLVSKWLKDETKWRTRYEESQGFDHTAKRLRQTQHPERAIDRYDRGVTPGAIYDMNQLEGMRMAEQAWNEVTPETIRNCWRKTGILPPSLTGDAPLTGSTSQAEALVTQAELSVTAALDDLQSTGALHASDRLDVEELVDPDAEKVRNDATDEEIYHAVMS